MSWQCQLLLPIGQCFTNRYKLFDSLIFIESSITCAISHMIWYETTCHLCAKCYIKALCFRQNCSVLYLDRDIYCIDIYIWLWTNREISTLMYKYILWKTYTQLNCLFFNNKGFMRWHLFVCDTCNQDTLTLQRCFV